MAEPETSVLRFDVTTNDWVLFAPTRAKRPRPQERPTPSLAPSGPCPFCPGNESMNPEEVLREGDDPAGWKVRAIRNKYPALAPTTDARQTVLGPIFREMGGYGVHEVIIESPDHDRTLPHQPVEQVELLLRVLHGRFASLLEDRQLRTIVVFKNHGIRAGTSLVHPHWQLIGTPVVPRLLRLKHMVATDYFDRSGTSLYVVALEEELRSRVRVLAANDDFVAVLPFASHQPYQVRILPRNASASFALVDVESLGPLAALLKDVLGRLEVALGDPAFNLTINTAPTGDEDEPYFVWHIDVLPRLTTPAGFELGSGMSINPVLPEDAAATLRSVQLGSVQLG